MKNESIPDEMTKEITTDAVDTATVASEKLVAEAGDTATAASEELVAEAVRPVTVETVTEDAKPADTLEGLIETDESSQASVPPKPIESMDDYKNELEASLKSITEGDLITGTVIGVSETEVILDLKYYAEGIIRLEDLSSDPDFSIRENINIGDTITATVIRKDDGQGNILLSGKEATDILAWDKLNELLEKQTILNLKIQGVVNAGVIVYLEGIRGFIPASQLSLTYIDDLEEWLHKEIEVRVITVDPSKKKLVLSAKSILKERADEERKAKISNVEVGLVTEGIVETIQPYGAFVNLGSGLSGLVHISQICMKRIKTPAAVVAVGDTVKVKIIGVKDGKISLSMKALEDVGANEIKEESIDLPKSEEISTNLGSLLANLKL